MQLIPGKRQLHPEAGDKGLWRSEPPRLFQLQRSTIAIPVQQAIRAGFVAHNECNGRTAQANPGEIVFWARPLPLWVPDFQ